MKRLLLSIALLFVVAVATAQVTTSSIRGTITANGKPLEYAAAVATHIPSGKIYGTSTGADGHYSISGMRVGGPYTIVISYIGYEDFIYENVELPLGEVVVFNTELEWDEDATLITEVNVVFSNRDMHTQRFSNLDMEQIPTIDRSIYDLTKLMSTSVSPASGGIILGGQSTRYNAFTIDGTSSADIYGLGTTGMTGSLTQANPIPLDAISQVQITTASVDLRESGFTGGSINAVTRSGSNEFHGSAYTYFNNERFWGTTPGRDITERTPLSEQMTNIVGITFGGPIIRDKLHFFVAGEFNRNTTPSTNHPGSAVSALTLEQARQISEHYKSLTGYDGGGYGEHNVLAITGSAVARLDWNINNSNTLSLRYNMLHADADAGSNTAQSFYFAGSEYTNINRTHSVVAELNTSKNWGSNALRIGYTRLKDGRTTPESLPAVIINGLGERENGSATIGTNPYSGCNILKQDVFIFGDDVTLNKGKHTITFGTSNEIYRADNLYLANARGTYTYASLDDFMADNATQYAYGYFANGEKNPPMTMGQFALYAQDRVLLNRLLVLTYGLRADIPVMFDTPVANEAFNNSYFAKHGTMTGDIPRVQILLSPRVGIEWSNYDILGGYRLSLRGSAGIYTGRIPFVWLSNCYQNTGLRSVSVSVNNPAETPDFSLNPESVGIAANPSIDLVSANFRYPQVFRVAAGATFDLYPWVIDIDADYTKGINNMFVENLVAEDNGQRLYVGGDNSDTSATYYNATTKEYSAVYRLSNTQRGYSWSATARVEYNFMYELSGLKVMAAYTYSQSKSINDGISAQSSTNWGRTYTVDSNNPTLSNSIYEFPHKVVASISYSRRYGLFGTNVMLLYNGYSGDHYSLTYVRGKIDENGDSYRGNSLIYIPTEAEMSSMLWADDTSAAAFNDYIEGDRYLRTHRGRFAERNSHSLPFVHRLDLHVAQSFYFAKNDSRRVELSLDVINLGNLLSRSWGLVHRTSNWTLSPVSITELQAVEGGYRPVYKFNGADYTVNDIASRWHMQIGLRVVF